MIKLQNKLNAVPVSSTYPYGDIKDNSGANDGTPVNRAVYADLHQLCEKMFAESGLTANNLPDNADNGFQLFQSLITVGNKNFAEDIIRGLLDSYTTGDLIILWGCVVTATIPGSSGITAGAIFYNGVIYKVAAATVVTTGSQTLVYKINTAVQPNVIFLTNDLAGTGIANYNEATIKYLNEVNFVTNTFTLTNSLPQTITTKQLSIDKVGRAVTVHFIIEFTVSAGGGGAFNDTFVITVPKYQNLTNGGKFGVANLIKIVAVGGTYIRTATCQSLNNGTIVVVVENAWTTGEQYKLQGSVSYAI